MLLGRAAVTPSSDSSRTWLVNRRIGDPSTYPYTGKAPDQVNPHV